MAVKNQINLGINIPPLANINPENGQRVNDGIAQVLKRVQDKGLIPATATYAGLEANPSHMQAFINQFKENRDLAADLVVDQAGNPIKDDTTQMVCGLTLAQVERSIVLKCAEKVFAKAKSVDGSVIPKDIKSSLAFAWQLPLLDAYTRPNTEIYFHELGEGILLLRTVAAVKAVTTTELADIRKAREATGDRFVEMLKAAPTAIKVIAHCSKKQFDFFARLIGPRVWKFFGDTQQLAVELLALDSKRMLALGPNFPDLCVATLHVLEEVPTSTLAPFMKSFDDVFGKPGRALLGDERFAQEFLLTVVGNFRGMEAKNKEEEEAVTMAAALKWNAIKPRLVNWIKARHEGATHGSA